MFIAIKDNILKTLSNIFSSYARGYFTRKIFFCLLFLCATPVIAYTETKMQFQIQTGTALHETGDDFAFGVLPNGDVVAIKKYGTGTKSTEVHILDASSGYKNFRLQTGTALHETGDDFAFGVLPNGDVVAIKKYGTGTKSTEVHILDASSGYKNFRLQTGTALHETNTNFSFAVLYGDKIFAFKKRNTGTNSTEVHILVPPPETKLTASSFDKVIIANPGDNIDLYEVFNMSGDLSVKIMSEDGRNCMTSWWIKMGVIDDRQEVCNTVHYTFSAPLVYMKLRAGHFSSKTLLFIKYGKTNISVSVGFDETMKFNFIVVDGRKFMYQDFKDIYEVANKCGTDLECWGVEARKRLEK